MKRCVIVKDVLRLQMLWRSFFDSFVALCPRSKQWHRCHFTITAFGHLVSLQLLIFTVKTDYPYTSVSYLENSNPTCLTNSHFTGTHLSYQVSRLFWSNGGYCHDVLYLLLPSNLQLLFSFWGTGMKVFLSAFMLLFFNEKHFYVQNHVTNWG